MRSQTSNCRQFAAAGLVVGLLLTGASSASAQSGGTPAPGGGASSTPTTTGKPGKAKLLPSGRAVPPANAPQAVINAIEAGNRIRKKPYLWGGGHGSFEDKGYDCSGAVSYVLNGAGVLDSPMASGSFMKWEEPGKGKWITTFANPGHMYTVVAGLRYDTSAMGSGGRGPRWRATKRSPKSFAVRHPSGL